MIRGHGVRSLAIVGPVAREEAISAASRTVFDLDFTTGEGLLKFSADVPALTQLGEDDMLASQLEDGDVLVSEPIPGVAPAGFSRRSSRSARRTAR